MVTTFLTAVWTNSACPRDVMKERGLLVVTAADSRGAHGDIAEEAEIDEPAVVERQFELPAMIVLLVGVEDGIRVGLGTSRGPLCALHSSFDLSVGDTVRATIRAASSLLSSAASRSAGLLNGSRSRHTQRAQRSPRSPPGLCEQ